MGWRALKEDTDHLERNLKRYLRPHIEFYGLLDINKTDKALDNVLGDIARGVMKVLKRDILSANMIEPLSDLFMRWQKNLPNKQRRDFYGKVIWPALKKAGKIDSLSGLFVAGKFQWVATKTANKIQEELKLYREKFIQKLERQIGECEKRFTVGELEAQSSRDYKYWWKSENNRKWRQRNAKKSKLSLLADALPGLSECIGNVSNSLADVVALFKKLYNIEDVNFNQGRFLTKVLRNLLEPIVGTERYQSSGGCTRKKCVDGWYKKRGKLPPFKNQFRRCECVTTLCKKQKSILYSVRDEILPIFLSWVDGLPTDHQIRIVDTITAKLGWWKKSLLTACGYASPSMKWQKLRAGIKKEVNSEIEKYITILRPQVRELQKDARLLW